MALIATLQLPGSWTHWLSAGILFLLALFGVAFLFSYALDRKSVV